MPHESNQTTEQRSAWKQFSDLMISKTQQSACATWNKWTDFTEVVQRKSSLSRYCECTQERRVLIQSGHMVKTWIITCQEPMPEACCLKKQSETVSNTFPTLDTGSEYFL